jgi:3-phosphoshikimate 1-carboxyvinyltransferase
VRIEPAAAIHGHVAVPGDKSLSHRAVLLAAVSDGECRISGFGRSGDTEATVAAVRALGIRVYEADDETLRVFGNGLRGLEPPAGPIDCGNAGTLMRLLPGLLAGQEGRFELTGDESLRSRPMERIAEPLRRMGVRIETTHGCAPLAIEGGPVNAIAYELPVASAQVKSAVLLAGLFA